MTDVARTAEDRYIKGFVKRGRRLFVPTMPSVPKETRPVRSEAYALAMANQHKPWARRYLRSLGGFR